MEMSGTGKNRLKNMPITFFAIVLGFSGLTLAVLKTEEMLHFSHGTSTTLLTVSLLLFSAVSFLYLLKSFLFPKAVADEFRHPVRIIFFPAYRQNSSGVKHCISSIKH
jgi:tellurite resistance protein